MDKAALAAWILNESHRPDLTALTDTFIEQAEGMIARRCRALDMLQNGTIVYADRPDPAYPLYTLPDRCLEIRGIWTTAEDGTWVALEPKSPFEIRRLSLTAPVRWYYVRGQNVIEFRGDPSDTLSFDIEYYERPTALDVATDTNDLLTDHPEVYISASLFFLHRYTQDLDIAQGFADSFSEAVNALNALAARKTGGASIAPVYNFNPVASY